MTPHPTHIEAVADATASSMTKGDAAPSTKCNHRYPIDIMGNRLSHICMWCKQNYRHSALLAWVRKWLA